MYLSICCTCLVRILCLLAIDLLHLRCVRSHGGVAGITERGATGEVELAGKVRFSECRNASKLRW